MYFTLSRVWLRFCIERKYFDIYEHSQFLEEKPQSIFRVYIQIERSVNCFQSYDRLNLDNENKLINH